MDDKISITSINMNAGFDEDLNEYYLGLRLTSKNIDEIERIRKAILYAISPGSFWSVNLRKAENEYLESQSESTRQCILNGRGISDEP